MIVESNLFKYTATFHLIYNDLSAKIAYLRRNNENFEEAVELFNNPNENYKIFVDLASEDTTLTLKSLTLEKYYSEMQNPENFTKYAEDQLLPILNKVIFLYSDWPQHVNYTRTIITPNYDSCFVVPGTLIIYGECLEISKYFERLEYEKICQDKINNLDNEIDDYLAINKFHDPELRLISAYRLYERIVENISSKTRKYNVAGKVYYKDNTDQVILELEYLAVATRNLVAHGSANNPDTVQALNITFSTPSAISHKFDRKNKQHMELVTMAAAKILYAIKSYIKHIL